MMVMTYLKKFLMITDIFEEVYDDGHDILEKLSNDGNDIFEKVFDNNRHI